MAVDSKVPVRKEIDQLKKDIVQKTSLLVYLTDELRGHVNRCVKEIRRRASFSPMKP